MVKMSVDRVQDAKDFLLIVKVVADLQFVKNAVFAQCSKAKCDEMRYPCK